MAHFAKVENDIVTEVIVAEPDVISSFDGEWIQTSYNTLGNVHLLGGAPLRGNFAAIGYIYDRAHDVFYPPAPDTNWTISEATNWIWEPPFPKPNDGNKYYWDKETGNWAK